MSCRQKLLVDFQNCINDTNEFIAQAEARGGMVHEARIKLLELQVHDLLWFVRQMLDCLAEEDKEPVDLTPSV